MVSPDIPQGRGDLRGGTVGVTGLEDILDPQTAAHRPFQLSHLLEIMSSWS